MMIWSSLDPKVLASLLVRVATFFESKSVRHREPTLTPLRGRPGVEEASRFRPSGNHT